MNASEPFILKARYISFSMEKMGLWKTFLSNNNGMEKVTNKGVQLNISKILVMMHYGDLSRMKLKRSLMGMRRLTKNAYRQRFVPHKYSPL